MRHLSAYMALPVLIIAKTKWKKRNFSIIIILFQRLIILLVAICSCTINERRSPFVCKANQAKSLACLLIPDIPRSETKRNETTSIIYILFTAAKATQLMLMHSYRMNKKTAFQSQAVVLVRPSRLFQATACIIQWITVHFLKKDRPSVN